jgi:hypothetical protein
VCPMSNCEDCEFDMCLECKPGLYIGPQGKCIKNCGDNYFKNEDEGTCDQCPIGCYNCESDIKCTSCTLGYQLNYRNECEECDDNCLSCELGMCLECAPSFLNEDGLCV